VRRRKPFLCGFYALERSGEVVRASKRTGMVKPPTFVVTSVYYKYAEYDVCQIVGSDRLRAYLLHRLHGYYKFDASSLDPLIALPELARIAIREGEKQIQGQYGMGIVAIVQGKRLDTLGTTLSESSGEE